MNLRSRILRILKSKDLLCLIFILLTTIFTRYKLLKYWYTHFYGDEAVVGLMARHILEGEIPVFYYGQEYLGSLEALVASFYFHLFGSSPLVLKLSPFTFFLLFQVFSYFLFKKIGGRSVALIACQFLVLSPNVLLAWSTEAQGGHLEVLTLGVLSLLVFLKYSECSDKKKSILYLFLLGLVIGIGWWTSQTIIFFLIPIFIYFLTNTNFWKVLKNWFIIHKVILLQDLNLNRFLRFLLATVNLCLLTYGVILVAGMVNSFFTGDTIGGREIKILMILLVLGGYFNVFLRKKKFWPTQEVGFLSGFFLGYLPVILFRLTGQAGRYSGFGYAIVPLSRALKNLSLLYRACLPEILGTKFNSHYDLFLHYLSYYLLFIYICAIIYLVYQNRRNTYNLFKLKSCKNDAKFFLLMILFFTPMVFIGSTYPVDRHSFRYLLALYLVLPFLIANFLYLIRKFSRTVFYIFLWFTLLFFAYVNLSICGDLDKENNSYNQLIAFLNEKGITRAYANYWISYPITFISKENIIVAPYKSRDRYPRYTKILREESTPSYIFRLYNREDRSDINQLERSGKLHPSAAYKKERVGDYIIYYVSKSITQDKE